MSAPSAPASLERADIQGNILEGYRLPCAEYHFFRVEEAMGGRRFVAAVTKHVTTAERWRSRDESPVATVNVGFTYRGLEALQLPAEALQGFPLAFRQGMLARADVLGDRGESAPAGWEEMWRTGGVHLWVGLHAESPEVLMRAAHWLESCRTTAGGVATFKAQEAGLLVINGERVRKEHFGFTDGLSNPAVAGACSAAERGSGKLVSDDKWVQGKLVSVDRWVPIAAGEFLLGHVNEQGEVAPTPSPAHLFRNGTFMVYRKLHEKVATFRQFLKEEGAEYPGGPDLLAAKLVGRWRDGTPLALSAEQLHLGTPRDPEQRKLRDTDFGFADDPDGLRCPLGAHIRRANPRDSVIFASGLAFKPSLGSMQVARRRIIRRGLPYGDWTPEDEPGNDDAEHGVIFMALNASLENQFEFVQEQWMNYGGDNRQGNDPDPLVGTHGKNDKLLIPGDTSVPAGNRPHVCFHLPSFVVTKGGDYFFLPSLTALRWIGKHRGVPAAERAGRDGARASIHFPFPVRSAMSGLENLRNKLAAAEQQLRKEFGDVAPEETPGMIQEAQRILRALPEAQQVATGLQNGRLEQKDRKDLFDYLRRIAPILVIDQFALVTRYDDVQEVLAQDRVFAVPYAEKFGKLLQGRNFFLGMQDSAEFERDRDDMRRVVRREDAKTRIALFVEQTAEQLVAEARGRLNVVEFGAKVPIAMVGDYFGIPSPSPDLAKQAGVMLAYLFLQASDLEANAISAAKALRRSMEDSLAERKRRRGRDDVLERCLGLQDKGEGMGDDRIIDNLFSLAVAAIPTTVSFIARAIDQLLRRPNELAKAHEAAREGNHEEVAKYLLEAIRFNALGAGLFREATENYTLARGTWRKTTIPKGATVLAALESAMMDGDWFERPQEFLINRPRYDYMPFGHGLHICFGRHINEVQLPRIAAALLKQPRLRPAQGEEGELQFKDSFPVSLVVEFDT